MSDQQLPKARKRPVEQMKQDKRVTEKPQQKY
jgi:hypothetical protein